MIMKKPIYTAYLQITTMPLLLNIFGINVIYLPPLGEPLRRYEPTTITPKYALR